MTDFGSSFEHIITNEWGRVTAALFRRLGDLQLAEDALQDALEQALVRWPLDGVPDQPAAWLLRVATRKAIDHIRRQANFRTKQDQVALLAELEQPALQQEIDQSPVPDERLGLIFTCCHPALSHEAQVALTLKTVGGMSVPEIARAFLVMETNMAQRLVRAKRKIKAAGIPYNIPDPEQWAERLSAVLATVYFVFNEGYAATSGGEVTRSDLCLEAIRLGRILADLLPNEAEVLGLAALMLLHDARRVARSDEAGNIIPLEFQNRRKWHSGKIADGSLFLKRALDLGALGPYQLQAIISAAHDHAPSFADTNWSRIVDAYDQLNELNPSPVLILNKAVALSFAEDTDAGLALLKTLEIEPRLAQYQPFHAAHADMLRRAGDETGARKAYGQAIKLTDNEAEKRFLKARMDELEP